MGVCMEEVTHSMKISSLKGVPRIFSTRSSLHKTLWTVAVICFFGVCLLTVSANILQYLEYPKVVNVEEKRIDPADPNGTVPFPAVIVCSMNQFSDNQSAFEANGIPLPSEYHRKVNEITKCVNCSKEKRKLINRARRRLMTSRGYYQYVGMHNIAKVTNKDLVLKCDIWFLAGSSVTSFPCHEFTSNYSFIHPDAGVCYVYRPNPSPTPIVGYTFLFHLDSSTENMNTIFSPDFFPQLLSGAGLYVFDPYTALSVLGTGSLVTAGMVTVEYFKAVRTDRLSTPYSERECLAADRFEKLQYNDQLYNYDAMSCFGQCSVAYVAKKCNCTDLWLMHNPMMKPPAHEFCASLKHSVDQLFKNFECAEKMRTPAFMSCKEKCKEPCKEIKYVLSPTTGKWPLPSQIPSFYKNIIQNNPSLSQKYKKHLETANALAAGYTNISDVARLLAARVIENNFATVNIYQSDMYYTHHDSKPKITFAALISQLGGSFNLWSGITVMFLVEIIDLVIRIICRVHGGRIEKKKEALPMHTPPLANSEDSSV